MSRILSIDFGLKRTGLAVTDPLQIIAQPLTTVKTEKLLEFMKNYLSSENVEEIIIGYPLKLDGTEADIIPNIKNLAEKLKSISPSVKILFRDERYTSKRAVQDMIKAGIKKKDRRKKENIDKIAATILLQAYLEEKKNNL